MKSHTRLIRNLMVLSSAIVLSASAAVTQFSFQPESRLWIEGTSTLRDFTCAANALDGEVAGAPGTTRLELEGLDAAVQAAEVTIAVTALDCRNGTMNSHLRKALKSEAHPLIQYRLSDYDVLSQNASGAQIRMTGVLTMAGEQRSITMDATASPTGAGGLRVVGSEELVMTEYGMRPPSLMLGTIRVGDRVRVHFDMVLGSQGGAGES